MVLFCLLAFFAVVAGANAFLVKAALSTFGGVETDSSYRAGLAYSGEIDAAHIQEARHWRVSARFVAAQNGKTAVEVSVQDQNGRPLSGLQAAVLLAHPSDRRHDQTVDMGEDAPGHFRGLTELAAGGWDLVIELSRAGERVFRSRSRVGVSQ